MHNPPKTTDTTPMTPLVLDREAVKQSAFATWSNATLADQCRMQVREQLDPEFSAFMEEIAERLSIIALTSQAGGLVEAERERCAKIPEGLLYHPHPDLNEGEQAWNDAMCRASTAIRASNPSVGGGV